VNHRRAIVGLFVISALVAGTAAYDVARSDRPAEVVVADDDEAYLSFEPTDETVANGSTGTVLVVTNHLGRPVDLRAEETTAAGDVSLAGLNGSDLGTGEHAGVRVSCAGSAESGSHTVTVEFTATGDGASVETTREVAVECERTGS
jgi:hypothetical protein